MTRWLEAARKAGWHGTKGGEETPAPSALRFCQVSSGVADPSKRRAAILSGSVGLSGRAKAAETPQAEGDPETLLEWLRLHGPSTYGAAATALGWGVTRAWRAEAQLRAEGTVRLDRSGKASLV